MKILIWLGCIAVYSVVVTACRFGGVTFGALPTVLLLLVLVVLPAPALCRQLDKKRDKKEPEKKPWPAPGEKLCGTPFIKAGDKIPGAAAPEPVKKRGRTRLEVILAVACAALVVTSAVLGYKVYEFRGMVIAFVSVNDELLQENKVLEAQLEEARSESAGLDSYTMGYLEARAQMGLPYYVASQESYVYHRSSCEYVDAILERNCVYYTSEESAREDGKVPCSVCNP